MPAFLAAFASVLTLAAFFMPSSPMSVRMDFPAVLSIICFETTKRPTAPPKPPARKNRISTAAEDGHITLHPFVVLHRWMKRWHRRAKSASPERQASSLVVPTASNNRCSPCAMLLDSRIGFGWSSNRSEVAVHHHRLVPLSAFMPLSTLVVGISPRTTSRYQVRIHFVDVDAAGPRIGLSGRAHCPASPWRPRRRPRKRLVQTT